MEPKWLTWAKELQAIAQAGLAYSKDAYDRERFQQVRQLAAQIVAEHTGLEQNVVRGLFCNENGYQTPKVDVRAAVFRAGAILLVRERVDGRWSLPGGWAEPGLSLRENVQREVREEAGLIVEARRLVAVLDRRCHNDPDRPFPYGVYKAFVLCRELGAPLPPTSRLRTVAFSRWTRCRKYPPVARPPRRSSCVSTPVRRIVGKRCSTDPSQRQNTRVLRSYHRESSARAHWEEGCMVARAIAPAVCACVQPPCILG